MKTLMTLLLLCHVSSAVKHSLRLYLMGSYGVPNFPEFVAIGNFDDVIMTYYDSSNRTIEPRQSWVRKSMKNGALMEHWQQRTEDCREYQDRFKNEIVSLKQHLNPTGGALIKQQILSCEWDDETQRVDSYNLHAYNGEHFLTFDLETATWKAAHPQAEIIKREHDKDIATNAFWRYFLTQTCPTWLKKYLKLGKSYVQRTVSPSVSLLQRNLSSPVRCHATGFYPDKAKLFWRKTVDSRHEILAYGESLPNHDGTFQKSVDLDLLSVTPEEWGSYECVFQLSGVTDIVTELDKAVIRTNEVESGHMIISIIVASAVLALTLITANGFIIYKRKKAECPPCSPDSSSEVSEQLNPNT